jgi:hypothetical protein
MQAERIGLVTAAASALSIVPLLKTMMVPSDHATEIAPDAGISGVNAFIHAIKSTFNYDVKPDVPPGTVGNLSYSDVVSYGSGLYLSLPQESHESLWHMGFVMAGSGILVQSNVFDQYPAASVNRGFDTRPHYFGATQNNGTFGTITNYNTANFTYIGDLALPRVGANFGITFATNVSKNYSKVRAFAADYKISSTTISGSNIQFNGVFHSGVISDTRYSSQIQLDTGFAKEAYPAIALTTQSITRPDDLNNVTVAAGAIDIMGPDYPRQWCSVDVDATDTLASEWKSFPYAVTSSVVSPLVSNAVAGTIGCYHVAQLWVTPTDTEFYISNKTASVPGGAPANWQKISYGAINEDGVLDIDISIKASIARDITVLDEQLIWQYVANFIHVFAYVGVDGLVHYNFASEKQSHPYSLIESFSQQNLANNGATGNANITQSGTQSYVNYQPEKIVKCRPRMTRVGMASLTGGKYLGTLCTLSMYIDNWEEAKGGGLHYVYAYPGTVRVRARNVDAPGRVGPAHIIRYDGLGVGQQMSFSGTTWIQGIALGQLAPFIQTNGFNLTVPDNIFSKFVELLWSMSPKYRRIMTLQQYITQVKPYFKDLDLRELLASLNSLDPDTASMAKSLGYSGGWLPASAGGLAPASSNSILGSISNSFANYVGAGTRRLRE